VNCLSERSEAEKLRQARNSPENKQRLAELKKLEAADGAGREAVAKFFDPVALMARASETHEVKHPQLGLIRFGELMLSDSELVSKCKTKNDRSAMVVYLMLKKAYPGMQDYTPETIKEFYKTFPMVEGTALLQFFLSQPCFLEEKSVSGSEQTQVPTS
jgi:hypothetical protein